MIEVADLAIEHHDDGTTATVLGHRTHQRIYAVPSGASAASIRSTFAVNSPE